MVKKKDETKEIIEKYMTIPLKISWGNVSVVIQNI